MVSVIWDLLPIPVKVGLGILIVFMILGVRQMANRVENLKKDLTTSEVARTFEKSLYDAERDKSKQVIDTQNKAIENFNLSKEVYKKNIYLKSLEVQEDNLTQQEVVTKDLSKDSSSDNQIKIITNILKGFANEVN